MIIGIIASILIVLFLVIWIVVSLLRPHYYKSCGVDLTTAEGEVEFIRPKEGTPYLIKRKSDGSISDEPFKILTCADMHNCTDHAEFGLTILSRFIEKERPDLVLLIGDNVVGRSDTVMQERVRAFFEERKQYWGFILGNHDSEYKIKQDIIEAERKGEISIEEREKINASGRKWMFDTLAGGKYCIVSDEGGEEVFGSGNCVVNIRNSKNISQSLFFFDSGDYIYGVKRKAIGSEKRCYGYIRDNQIDWYRRRLEELAMENGGEVPKSIAFFHIPLREYQDAFRAFKMRKRSAKHFYGNNYEAPCSSNFNAGVFEAFRSLNSTKITVCGHDHKNDASIEYKGVRLMYSQGLQYDGSYNRRKKAPFLKLLNRISSKLCCFIEGVSLFMVKDDGNVDVAVKYAQKEDVFYGLEEYYERAFVTGSEK